MEKFNRDKVTGILALIAALAAMSLVAAALGNLQFDPAKPFSLRQDGDVFGSGQLPGGGIFITILRLVFMAGWVILPIVIIFLLLTKEGRRHLLRDLAAFTVIMGLLFLFQRLRQMLAGEVEIENEVIQTGIVEFPTPAPEITFAADPPRWIVLGISLAISTLIVLLVVLAVRFWRKRRQPQETILQNIARQAGSALEALYQGEDINQVILRCYLEMNKKLAQQRGWERRETMTSQEFVRYLVQRGLPEPPLQSLTRLFENVRYGAILAGEKDKQEAIASLNAILEACKRS